MNNREMLKFFLFICAMCVVANYPSGASEAIFLQFPFGMEATITYDLRTVQLSQPGRFTIIAKTIDDPDAVRFELKALNVARGHCARPFGHYSAPNDLFTLGRPDLPIKDIMVVPFHSTKIVRVRYPYKRLRVGTGEGGIDFNCGRPSEFTETYNTITKGIYEKYLFDCERGLTGNFLNENDSPAAAIIHLVSKGTLGAFLYKAVCRAVTHKEPFMPKNNSSGD